MRVGFITSDLHTHNGWSAYSLNIINELGQLGVEPVIISPINSPDHPQFEQLRILPPTNPFPRFISWRILSKVLQVRAAFTECDVIHATIEPFGPLATWSAGQRPAFISVHGTYAHLPQMRRFPFNYVYQHSFEKARLLAVSQYTKQRLLEIVPQAEVAVIPNGVDYEAYRDVERRADPYPTIISVGGVKPRKGSLELIQAIGQLKDEFPTIRCVIIGNKQSNPDYTAQVEAFIQDHSLEKHVELTGFLDEAEVLDWYSRSTVFVMPSMNHKFNFEGFGLVHLIASACGLPVIGTWGCGIEEAIEDGKTGFLVPQEGIEEALPAAIRKILSDPDLAKQMGNNGRKKAESMSWAAHARALLKAYQGALN